MKVCSLFAGVGGIDLAFKQAGFEIVWANEFDHNACLTYKENFTDHPLVEADIRKIDAGIIPDFDILTAGFPCQSFSVCGKQKGFKDERGNLFFEICRVIDEKSPRILFLENVANLVDHDDGRTFITIHNELVSRGYYIRYIIADACEYGVPQHRTRTYIVAFKDYAECTGLVFPHKTALEKKISDIIDFESKAAAELYFCEDSKEYQKLVAFIDDPKQVYRFSDYGIQKGRDGISFTLKANMGTWRGREPIVKDHYGIRKLSAKECFLLQGFPGTFKLPNIAKEQLYKQAGNTVCVPIVRQIAAAIKMAAGENEILKAKINSGDTLWWVNEEEKKEGTVQVVRVQDDLLEVLYKGIVVVRPISCIGKTLFLSSQLKNNTLLRLCSNKSEYLSDYIPF